MPAAKRTLPITLSCAAWATQTKGTTLYPSMMNQRLSDDNLRGFFATLENGGTLELSMEPPAREGFPIRALYSDGRTMDGALSIE
jgi:hypothetical protein